jgi:hypothetical protein
MNDDSLDICDIDVQIQAIGAVRNRYRTRLLEQPPARRRRQATGRGRTAARRMTGWTRTVRFAQKACGTEHEESNVAKIVNIDAIRHQLP